MTSGRPATVYLGLGANLGDREGNILRAVESLKEGVNIERLSSLYETAPVGILDQPDFLNAACRGQTTLTPGGLLALCKRIEASLGRVSSLRNAPRPIDIDILLYGHEVIDNPRLTVPHPRMTERAFVLVPMAEIAPKLLHPVLRESMEELLAEVGTAGVRLLRAAVREGVATRMQPHPRPPLHRRMERG